jgi:large subunit ribosomal protein L31
MEPDMKPDLHPTLNPCVFVDASSGQEFVTRSTLTSPSKRDIDGVEHFVINVDISSASHPFYTGKQRVMDREGRVARFKKKYGR